MGSGICSSKSPNSLTMRSISSSASVAFMPPRSSVLHGGLPRKVVLQGDQQFTADVAQPEEHPPGSVLGLLDEVGGVLGLALFLALRGRLHARLDLAVLDGLVVARHRPGGELH